MKGVCKMNFVDWNWKSYAVLRRNPELKKQQERFLYGTGLYEGEEGLEYSFVPTKTMEQLEAQLFDLYPKIQVVDNTIILCNEIFSTSKIEGAKTTFLRTQQIHDGAEIDDSNFFSESMVLGGFRATKYLNSIGNQVTLDKLIEVWKILTDGACDNESIKGERFRTGHVAVGKHTGLNPDLIEEAMQNWVDYYNSDILMDHPFIKAALLHFSFEYIHPFCDGNGRSGRLLMNNFLIKEGMEKIKAVSFSRSIEKDRPEYDYAFSRGENPQTDCTFFIEYMLGIFLDAFLDVCEESIIETHLKDLKDLEDLTAF